MKTLIVGLGALGVLIAARLRAAGVPAWLATRTPESAARLNASGLRVSGTQGSASVDAPNCAALDAYSPREAFDLILLATKAHDAIDVAPRLIPLLSPGGTLLPIQNGAVAQLLADMHGHHRVLGGLSSLGATLIAPGYSEQRNAGQLLIGEIAGGGTDRADRIVQWLSVALPVKLTHNFTGAVWTKLLLNCSVTTLGAIAGQTMRQYIVAPGGRELFEKVYAEALATALASGAQLEPMIVHPIPPNWDGRDSSRRAYDDWLNQVISGYGDLKPSMLDDFQRRRPTEIDFINGYIASVGRKIGVSTPLNATIAEVAQGISQGRAVPHPTLLQHILRSAQGVHCL